jgi:uncharacterized protein (DUF1499 family)
VTGVGLNTEANLNAKTETTERSLARGIVLVALVLAVAGAVAALMSGIGYRVNWWHFGTGIQMFKWSAYAAILAVGLSVIGLAWSRKSRMVVIPGVLAIIIGGIMVYIPLSWKQALDAYPYIHDITTDVDDPPQFVAVAALRGAGDHPVTYDGPEVASQQQQAYADLQPWNTSTDPATVFAAAMKVLKHMGLEIVASNDSDLHIEATDTSLLYGFKDDVVVRIVETGEGARVDVRSKSRVGRSDLGQNAKRIRTFTEGLKSELSD